MTVVTSLQEPIGTRKIIRARMWKNKVALSWVLPILLVFQAIISWVLLQNTIFQDEALYLYAGRQILQSWAGGPAILDNYSYYFSGNPYIYPLIGGALDFLGGTELARAFSLVCMLIVTMCGYHITKWLFGQKSAVFAAIFLVCQGPILFLGRLATYDPMCLSLPLKSVSTSIHVLWEFVAAFTLPAPGFFLATATQSQTPPYKLSTAYRANTAPLHS